MKLVEVHVAIGAALLFLTPCAAKHGHSHNLDHLAHARRHNYHNHNHHHVERSGDALSKRDQCVFPTDAGLVAVTPGEQNAGWAMSPDQPCLPGHYCQYACPPGQVMSQWNPAATSYVYPLSMQGGLFCDSNGEMSKPFPDKPYCVEGTDTLGAQNLCSGTVAFCQTVLPGNEAMLIPTAVDSWAQLAVPDLTYWAKTSAHYYINTPGLTVEEACIWGDGSKPLGNWAAYVAGANTDGSGNTFAKIGWNPEYTGSSFAQTTPTFGIKIVCSGPGCNGTPCSIDPSVDGVGGVTSSDQASGAGGANFCVVTIPKGTTANIVIFHPGASDEGSGAPESSAPAPKPSPSPKPTPSPTPSSSSSVPASTSASEPASVPSSSTALPKSSGQPHVLFQQGNSSSSSGSTSTTAAGQAPSTGASTSPAATHSAPSAAYANSVWSGALYFTCTIAALVALF